jgi:hypothetical protein
MVVAKKRLVIVDCDDLFDADYDDEEAEEEEVKIADEEAGSLLKIDKKKLVPGTLIVIRDLNARVGSNAIVAKPGINEDGM